MPEQFTMNETPADAGALTPEEQDSLAVGESLQQDQDAMLAGKYKNAQELEKAYIELQQKMGEGQPQAEEPQQEEATDDETSGYLEDGSVNYETVSEDYGENLSSIFQDNGIDPYEMGNFYDENGGLADEHYAKLEKAGFNREVVDQFLGQQTEAVDLSQDQVNTIKESVGGEETYQEIISWAANNLSEDYIQGFDSLVESGNGPAIQMAVAGLQQIFEANMGKEGTMLQGKAPTQGGSVFRSQAELVQAMADPRYDNDPAYRQDVIQKLERSNVDF
jgi:hypothetical protein